MDAKRWKKIEEVFQSALDCPADARQEFISETCGGDEELCREVNKLIARYETEETFLESPVWTDSRVLQSEFKREIASSLEEEIAVDGRTKSFAGRRVGAYRLTKEIGRGGMGVVYLGERADGEFNQKVAVKLIKRGMDTDFIVRRFRHERQILAALSHPNIARLFDGGTTTDDDLPYFAMEFVEGEPLFKFCEKHNLDIAGRLKIFREICAAVAYAHSKHIVHRDIKPGNILVTEDGAPKLLDFGIAKILDPDSIHESLMPTATQMRLMTPEYASPEQVRGEEITPASDQYSLGVLLYELVTGARPYKFPSRAPHEIARIVCEQEPISLSSVVSGSLSGASNEPLTTGSGLERIILKSLRKDSRERYDSVAEFSEDIERFLNNKAIRAENVRSEKQTIPIYRVPQTEESDLSEAQTVRLADNSKRRLPASVKYALATIAVAVFGYLFYNVATHLKIDLSAETGGWRASNFASVMNVKRLTTSGKTTIAAVSPDGKNIAYAAEENERQSLWLRSIDDAGDAKQIVADDAVSYNGLTFAPDGKAVFYTASGLGYLGGAMYRLALEANAAPQKITGATSGSVAFSPDGKRIAFFGYDTKERLQTLNVAELKDDNTVGATLTKLTRARPDFFIANPAFAPDGKRVAFVAGAPMNESGARLALTILDLETMNERRVETRRFSDISSIAWRSSDERASEIVLSASESNHAPSQLWLVNGSTGETAQLTNDLSNYYGAQLTRDAQILIAVKRETNSNIWLADFTASAAAKQITAGSERLDGARGIRWTADGKILYVGGTIAENVLTEIDQSGAGSRVVETRGAMPVSPTATGDRRYIFFTDEREENNPLRRLDTLSGAITDIAPDALAPVVSPDNRYVLYSRFDAASKMTLFRVSIEGGEETQLTSDFCVRPAVSPDGRFIACYFMSEPTGGKWEIAVLNQNGGVPARFVKPSDTVNLQTPFERPLAWSPDSSAIFYLNDKGGVSNIYRASVEDGTATQLTQFTVGRIFDFAVAPDGKRAALARGTISSDVLIFRNSK